MSFRSSRKHCKPPARTVQAFLGPGFPMTWTSPSFYTGQPAQAFFDRLDLVETHMSLSVGARMQIPWRVRFTWLRRVVFALCFLMSSGYAMAAPAATALKQSPRTYTLSPEREAQAVAHARTSH